VTDTQARLRQHDEGLDVPVHVQPRARKTERAGFFNGALRLKVAAPPVDDAANRAVVEYFARALSLPRSRVRIVSGLKSREKVIRIEGMSAQDLRARLHLS